MTGYIERKAAKELLETALDDDWEPSYAVDRLNEIPAADVRPVVLCRDCIHARFYTNKIKCGYLSEQTASEIVCEDDFCSYGEKGEQT